MTLIYGLIPPMAGRNRVKTILLVMKASTHYKDIVKKTNAYLLLLITSYLCNPFLGNNAQTKIIYLGVMTSVQVHLSKLLDSF